MTARHILVALSLTASLAGCFFRARNQRPGERESRACPPSQHWERDRCVQNGRGHDEDERGRGRDHDHDHDQRR